MRSILIIGMFLFLLVGCKNNNDKATNNIVAKVYNYTLTKEELKKHIPITNSIVDSLKVTQQYIEAWAKQKLLYQNALINLDNTEELDQMVADYKQDLYVSYYKNALVNQKLDTMVVQQEIDTFYVRNKANFRLNETLIQFKYIHLEPDTRKKYALKKLFLSQDPLDKNELLNEYDVLEDYYLNDSTWVSLKSVYDERPEFPLLTEYQLTKEDRFIEVSLADKSIYYIYLNKILKDGEIAPLEYVKPTIKNIVLHKNKLKFFNQMEQILIEDAVKQKKYEVY
ncbi:hypothetical protein [Ochrovirga pacifica]|uniref:hypothetical protein n=1 Tax=Ochrovirga pacifica TaxID=1042376 RepID=UPI0002557F6D|nr:hypothetical protein [Ochrovirga pacifica]